MNMIIITNPSHPSQPLPRFLGPFFTTIFMITTMWWGSWRWISQFTWLESQLCFLSYLCNWFIFMIIMMEIVEILMMKMIKNLFKMIKTIKNLIKIGSTQTSVGDFPSWPTTEVSFKSKIFLSHLKIFLSHLKGLLKETFVLPTSPPIIWILNMYLK